LTPEQFDLLLKARQSVSAAKILLENGYSDYAASRAYYNSLLSLRENLTSFRHFNPRTDRGSIPL
jgi:uncharacterized protein (UPF0332 family)